MTFLLAAVAVTAFASGGVFAVMALVVLSIHAEERRMSLHSTPANPLHAAVRWLAGVRRHSGGHRSHDRAGR